MGLDLRTEERIARVEKARNDIASGGLGRMMGEADAAWIEGRDVVEVDIPLLLVLLVMAAERNMDIQLGLSR